MNLAKTTKRMLFLLIIVPVMIHALQSDEDEHCTHSTTSCRVRLPPGSKWRITLQNNNTVAPIITVKNDNTSTTLIPNNPPHSTILQNATLVPAPLPSPDSYSLASALLIIKAWSMQHWGKIALGSVAAYYGIIFAKLAQAHYFIERTDTWASWKSEMSYEQLTLMPADQLAQELMPAILAKYNMPMDLAHAPLFAIMQFIQECEQEQQALCSCISLCDFLEKSSLAALFPAHFMLTPLAQDKKERLHYLEQSITAICLEKIPQSSATRDDA